MPSHHANDLARCIQTVLKRPLSTIEQLQCEEIVLNVYPGAVKRFIFKWANSVNKRESKVLTFGHFYAPIMNGMLVGAMRRPKDAQFKFDTPNKRTIYGIMHAYLGTDFTMKELEDIVWFTTYSTIQELQTSISIAEHHGVVNCAYVRAIIVGNRRKAAAVLRSQDARFKKITDDPPDVLTGVPNVKSIQDAWTRRLKAAVDRSVEDDVERSASKKLQI